MVIIESHYKGWDFPNHSSSSQNMQLAIYYDANKCVDHYWVDYQRIIFSHDFAKAFWGETTLFLSIEQEEYYYCGYENNYYADCFEGASWQYHLQQMVLEEEPLKYLEKFLKD